MDYSAYQSLQSTLHKSPNPEVHWFPLSCAGMHVCLLGLTRLNVHWPRNVFYKTSRRSISYRDKCCMNTMHILSALSILIRYTLIGT